MNKNTKLTLDAIQKSNDKFESARVEEIILDINGEDQKFEIEIKREFSPIAIKKLINEFIKNMDFAKNMNRQGFGDITEPYLMYLIIKHFTNLGESMPNNMKEQLLSLEHMMNTGAFFQIISKLDENQINKLKVQLDLMLNMLEEKVDVLEDLKDEYYGTKIKSKVLMD